MRAGTCERPTEGWVCRPAFCAIPTCARQQPRQAILALPERQRPIVDAVEFQQIEGLQDGIGDTAAPVERVERGDPIGTADHGFAVQGERSRPQLGSPALAMRADSAAEAGMPFFRLVR
jgi:hypothetical protein